MPTSDLTGMGFGSLPAVIDEKKEEPPTEPTVERTRSPNHEVRVELTGSDSYLRAQEIISRLVTSYPRPR